MRARLAFWLLLKLALGLACLPAAAQDLVGQRAIVLERHGALTLAQASQEQFAAAGPIISLGYTGAALWVRLEAAAPPGARRLRLRLLPAQLEDVTLFSAQLPGAGLRLSERSTWIAADPGPNTYYLRVRTSGPMLLQPLILSEEQAQQEDVRRGFYLGLLLACYLPLLVWLLVLIATRRQLLHLVFLLNLSVVAAAFLGWLGYLAEFFPVPHWASSSATIYFLGIVNVFTGFLCVCLVLNRFGLPRWGRRLFAVLSLPYAALLIFYFVLDRQLVIASSTSLGLLASAFGLPLTVAVFYRQRSGTWLIGAIMLAAMALGLRWFLTVHGLVAAVDSLASLLFFRVFFAVGFVSATLWLLGREKQSRLQESITGAAVARRLAESETQRRESQERFMTMLMHELKTPLAIIQLAAGSLGRGLIAGSADATRVRHINRAVDDLNALVERCVSVDQIDQGSMPMHKQPLCLDSLAADVLRSVDTGRIRLAGSAPQAVFADIQYLRLILLNLLSNALKYSPPGSPVELRFDDAAQQGKPGLILRVSNAVGMAGMPDPAQVFARYYRAEGARRQVGAGLGLWLAQALTRQLGSELHFEAGDGQVGFSFFLELACN